VNPRMTRGLSVRRSAEQVNCLLKAGARVWVGRGVGGAWRGGVRVRESERERWCAAWESERARGLGGVCKI
jgi:hypothetical protein